MGDVDTPPAALPALMQTKLRIGDFDMSIEEIIVSRSAELAKAGSAGDWRSAAAMYTDDATLMIPDGPLIQGREQIEQFWKDGAEAKVSDFAYTGLEVFECGGLVIDINTLTFSVLAEDGTRNHLTGKAIVIWKKGTDGQWRLFRDIWNLDPTG